MNYCPKVLQCGFYCDCHLFPLPRIVNMGQDLFSTNPELSVIVTYINYQV
jgi:hypothetical protein